MTESADLDPADLWDAIGARDWTKVKTLLDTAEYALEDVGFLIQSAMDEEDAL